MAGISVIIFLIVLIIAFGDSVSHQNHKMNIRRNAIMRGDTMYSYGGKMYDIPSGDREFFYKIVKGECWRADVRTGELIRKCGGCSR